MALVKTAEEIEKMRLSAALLARCLDVLVANAKPGKTGLELDRIAEEFIGDHGATPTFKNYGGGEGIPPFPASICFSRNHVLVHGIPTEEEIEEGDVITIDCGLRLNGWCADAARLFGIGSISDEDNQLIHTAGEVLQTATNVCVAGNKLGDISATIQRSIARSPFFGVIQFCGHSIGEEMHEPPQVLNFGKVGTGVDLEAGMVLCLEPMLKKTRSPLGILPDSWTVITLDKSKAAHIEHMVLITEDRPEVLTL